ncbi:hypothetical protein ASE73_02410 [Sphingomonas sp. Leaf24]|uniref:hypothetical protein n=1 Tax=unclassified Sphingomonas TaxID=196159 RepID=UPI0006F62179|nr:MULTISPECIES: hypothetical protein [unclassified Sphingomonas]KQM23095.1 hypothetical protein ASE50_02410 [Sphingomonas sp. Leaf5]KQM95953.1 hypothetical protein ASE73_02410 [Sphingomonas sp. Leaf24]
MKVAGADHVLLLLRAKLARLARERADRSSRAPGRGDPRPVDRLRAMAGFDALGEDERRRAVVHGLLTEELGEAVANDAAFGAVLDDVLRIVGEMPGGHELIDRAAAAMRGR